MISAWWKRAAADQFSGGAKGDGMAAIVLISSLIPSPRKVMPKKLGGIRP